MIEREVSGYAPKVEVVYTSNQDRPFGVSRTGTSWQLSVNKAHFESKGYLPSEIEGAVYLEEERLGIQVSASSRSAVAGLRHWQEAAGQSPHAVAFQGAFERLAALSSLEERDTYKADLARKYLEKLASRSPGPTNCDQLFSTLLMDGLDHNVAPDAKVVETVVNNLKKPEKVEGRQVSPLDALVSPDLSFASKAAWFDARFLPRLEFLERQDKQRREQEEKIQEQPQQEKNGQQPEQEPTPPAAQDEYEQHRGREEKGKGSPTFIINPSYTGYWEEDSFDSINEETGRLVKSPTQRIRTAVSTMHGQVIEGTKRTISGNTGTDLFSLPLTAGFQLTPEGLASLKTQGIEVFADAEGHTFLQSPASLKMAAEIAMNTNISNLGINSKDFETSEQIPDEISDTLARIRSLPIDSLGKLQQWKDFISEHFLYPQDEQVESMYASVDGNTSRLTTMTQGKLLDCYLAREFFIAGLKRLNIEEVRWRAVNGHYVAAAQKDGTAHISSGTGHAWVKVRVPNERNWIIFDATPPGDPIHQGEGAMDEFAQSTPDPISQQDLSEMEKEAGDNNKKSTETQDHYLLQFAREAGVPEAEAKQILATLAQVDEICDRQGRSILKRLQEQFDRIIEKYTSLRQESSGLVEMSRGQTLEEPVGAIIDLRSGSFDPLGFERKKIVEDTEQFYGGWDLEIVADGSGSMSESLGGKVKYMVQRDMGYLLHRALHRFSQEAQRRKLRLVTPLKIRSSHYMFRGSNIEEIKPLSDEFTPLQMALLWKKSAENIGGGTPAHLGLQAILERIPQDEVQLLSDRKLLKVVALISDGGYDNAQRVKELIKRLEDMNVIVAEFPITNARSLEELPQNVAEKVIEAAGNLMPERVKKS